MGAATIPAIVKRGLNDIQLRNVQALENMSRSDMRPTEEAAAVERAFNQGQTFLEIGKSFGRSERACKELMRILKLPKIILDKIDAHTYPLALGKLLAKFPESLIVEAFNRTAGKSIPQGRMILQGMEVEFRQTNIFTFTSDQENNERWNRALSLFRDWKMYGTALLDFAPQDLVRFLKASEKNIEDLETIKMKVETLLIQMKEQRGQK